MSEERRPINFVIYHDPTKRFPYSASLSDNLVTWGVGHTEWEAIIDLCESIEDALDNPELDEEGD